MSADGQIEIQLKLDSNDYESALDRANQQTETFANELRNSTSEGSEGFTVLKGAIANMVSEGIQNAIQAIKDFAAETIQVGSNFDSSMSNVAAVSGATASEIDQLRDKAKEMGANTKFSATEAADAFGYMAMAGWKSAEMIDGIDGVLALAAAGNTDLATTSDIVTDALTAFGKGADDAGNLANIMAAASSNANTNVELLGESFKYVAPVAGAMGMSMEDTSIALGLMANAGIKGSQSGTALRTALTNMVKPSDTMASAMDRLGISITNEDGSMKSLGDVMLMLREKFSGLTESQQASEAAAIFGKEAMSGMLAIINASDTDFEKLTQSIYNSNGAAEDMAATMQDNLGGDMTTLGSKLEGLQISLYEQFEPALRLAVQGLQKLSDAFKWCVDNIPGFVPAIAGLAVAFGVLAGAMAISALIDMVKNAFLALNTALLSNPIVLVVAAIAGLATAFVMLWNKSEEFRNFWINLWNNVKSIVETVWNGISSFFSSIWPAITAAGLNIWNQFVTSFQTIWNGIVSFIPGIMSSITNAISSAWESITSWWTSKLNKWSIDFKTWTLFTHSDIKNFVKNITTYLTSHFGVIGQLLSNAITNISNVIHTGIEFISKIVFAFLDLLGGNWENAWENIKSAAEIAWNFIVSIVQGYIETFKSTIQTGLNFIKGIFEGIWNGITSLIDKVLSGIQVKIIQWTMNVHNAINSFVSNITSFLTSHFGILGTLLSNFITNVSNIIQSAINFIVGIVNAFLSLLKGDWQGAWNWIKMALSNVWNVMKSLVMNGVNTIKSLIKSGLDTIISKVTSFVSNMASKALEAGKKFSDGLINKVKEIPGKMLTIGKDIVNGIWNGIKGAWNGLVTNVKNSCSSLVSGFKSALSIHSPSRVFSAVAMFIPRGIAEGIQKGAHYALSAMDLLAENVVGTFKQSDLAGRFALETGPYGLGGSYIGGNTYTVNQTINSAKALRPSEIASQTENTIRRLEWQ